MIKVNGKQIEVGSFPDGTFLAKITTSDENILISWFYENDVELVALIYLTKHFRANGAKHIRLYMPYIPNARQDRVRSNEDIFTMKYFAEVINDLKFDKVSVLDPHSSVSEALIDNISVDSPDEFIKDVYDKIRTPQYNDGHKTTMFFPDEGAMKRYSKSALCEYTFGIKKRDWQTGVIKGLEVSGDTERLVRGCNILIVDDICSKGGTFYFSAQKLKELGANRIFLYITHCENSILEGKVLTSGLIDKVFTTNSILTAQHENIEVIKL